MRPTMFRALTEREENDFRAYVRLNYKVGDPIPQDIWHPISVEEAAKMNVEASRANPYIEQEEVRA